MVLALKKTYTSTFQATGIELRSVGLAGNTLDRKFE